MATIREELGHWNKAWRGLGENPVRDLLRRIEKNRRRNDVFIIVIASLFCLLWLGIATYLAGTLSVLTGDYSPFSAEYAELFDALNFGSLFGGGLLLVWTGYCLFHSLRACLACLAEQRELAIPGSIEEGYFLTMLNSRDLLLPVLWSAFRRLLVPVVLLNLSFALYTYSEDARGSYYYNNVNYYWDSEVPSALAGENLALLGSSAVWLCLSGLAGTLIMLLLALLAGRGLRSGTYINVAAGLAVLWFALWTVFRALRLHYAMQPRGGDTASEHFHMHYISSAELITMALYTTLAAVLFTLGLIALAQRRGWLRSALPLVLPLAALAWFGIPAAIGIALGAVHPDYSFLARLSLNNQFALGLFTPANGQLFGGLPNLGYTFEEQRLNAAMYEWWRVPLAFALQALLLTALARMCLRSADLARLSED